ncbi:MAG: nitrilase-related carbon-nitrogen hydrolase, partial [Candidatus Thiodiazotropha sp.]
MSTNNTKVAAIQMATSPNVSANLLEAERLISEAVEGGAGLVVLPENFAFMGEHDREMVTLSEEPYGGPLQGFLSQMAKRYGIWLVGGTIPLRASKGGKVRAACLVFDDKGNQVAHY